MSNRWNRLDDLKRDTHSKAAASGESARRALREYDRSRNGDRRVYGIEERPMSAAEKRELYDELRRGGYEISDFERRLLLDE